MKTYALLALFIVYLTSASANNDTLRQEIESLNLQFAKALEKGDVSAMMRYYAADAVTMPEFHASLLKPEAIAGYYKRWLAATKNNRYQRKIHTIEKLEGYVIETGIFIHAFTQTGHQPFHYEGKYVHIWRIGEKQKLKLAGEIWGATGGLDRASIPLSSDTGSVALMPVKTGENPVTDSIHHYNTQIAGLVKTRNGSAFSEFYTNDAIYMPYYSPMIMGKDSIHAYYVKHEDPAVAIDAVQINMSRILLAGNFAVVNGFYHVNWRAGEYSGRVTGKSINIWKRDERGKFRLYWQMTNHD